jgi:23S rRNA pseudouridine1911/1915/1917 synthase
MVPQLAFCCDGQPADPLTAMLLAQHIVYSDNHLLVVYKPAGIPTQADASGDVDLVTLAKAWVAHEFAKPGAVYLGLLHRLDRPARGLVALARTSKAAARLSAQFAGHTTRKTYRVVVHGCPPTPRGTLEHWLQPGEVHTRVVGPEQGQYAKLDYTLLSKQGQQSLLEVALYTGRKHQIRCQLAQIGCPVVGDLRYGAPQPLPDRSIALLAFALGLEHPTLHTPLLLQAPEPPGWPWRINEPRFTP